MKSLKNNLENTEIIIVNRIDEATVRINGDNVTYKADGGMFKGIDLNSPMSYGGAILSQLRSSLSRNFNVQVNDFGAQLVVTLSYTNIKTCRTAEQTYLIILTTEEGKGIVKSSSVRWRSIGNPGQAAAYILSRKDELRSKTESTN